MHFSLKIVSLLSVLICFFSNTHAQEKPSDGRSTALALEVTGDSGSPTEIAANQSAELWMGSVGRISDSSPAAPADALHDIGIRIKRDGDFVIAELFGRFENMKKIEIAEYKLRLGESISTAELTHFGFKPLTLTVKLAKIRESPFLPSIAPVVTNDLQSLQLLGIERDQSPRETYELALLNISAKNIVMVTFFTPSLVNSGGSLQTASGSRQKPLIKLGEVYRANIGNGRNVRQQPPGRAPGDPKVQWVIVKTILFDDGTYEGDGQWAATYEARDEGDRSQNIRILNLLTAFTDSATKGQTDSFQAFKEMVYALGTEPDQTLVNEIASRYADLADRSVGIVKSEAMSGMTMSKEVFVDEMEEIDELRRASPEKVNVENWIKDTIKRLQKEIAER